MEYGIQMYGVRDMASENFEKAVREVSKLGYSNLEFAGFFDRTAEQVVRLLEENNVRVSGTHSSLDDLINNYDSTVDFHKAIGNKLYIIPGYKLSCQSEIDYFVEWVNKLNDKLALDGITLAFHNHWKEFVPNADGSVAFEQILYRTDIKLEVDTYWAFIGMNNPITLLDRVADRLVAIHIKDGDADKNGTPLGMGDAPVKEVYEKALSLGLPLIVESETCNPSGIKEAEICMNYLKSLEK